jgi:ferredoxin
MQFCLFGVYALDENGKVTVANPDNCKSGCPACSRICPHSAIMFPLYGRDPAIAGAPGRWVVLDLAGRRLYYNRTGATCPRCGQSGTGPALRPSGAAECPECGRAVAPPKDRPADDLDKLINDLDQLMDRRR